jgi:uncharacterized protein (DUF952 family)
MPELVFKVATRDLVEEAQESGTFVGMPVDAKDGYIHLSTAEQLEKTLSLHFAGQSDLVLLAIRTEDVADALQWEPSRGGALFPHLYGALPMDAVAWQETIAVDENGHTDLTERLR